MIKDKFQQNTFPGIISQPKAEIILKSYGLNAVKKALYSRFETDDEDEQDGKSNLGTPVFDNIIFKAPVFTVKKSDGTEQQVLLQGNTTIGDDGSQPSTTELGNILSLGRGRAFRIDAVLIEVMQGRNVVVTPIAGGNGTVKEYIGEGDYVVKIRGFIESDAPNKYPTSEVGIFSSYLKAPVPIEVFSNFLRSFNINQIVVTDYTIPQTEGRRNLQFFELTAISEQNLESEFITDQQ